MKDSGLKNIITFTYSKGLQNKAVSIQREPSSARLLKLRQLLPAPCCCNAQGRQALLSDQVIMVGMLRQDARHIGSSKETPTR